MMMMGQRCQIKFDDSSNATYLAGEVATGKVIVSFDQPYWIKGIALKVNGFARTKWAVNSKCKKQNAPTEMKSFEGRQDYMASITYLIGSEDAQPVLIEPGVKEFNFECGIPDTSPSSFDSQYGQIEYLIKVVFICPSKPDEVYTVAFNVINVFNLNHSMSMLKPPAHHEISQSFCFKSKPVFLSCEIPHTGYIPGQKILVNATLENSSIRLKGLHFKLNQLVTYYSQTPKLMIKYEKKTLTEKVKQFGGRKQNETLLEILQIPPIPPTCENLCKIIKISYEVELLLESARESQNVRLSIPITIGTVAFVGDEMLRKASVQYGSLALEMLQPQHRKSVSNISFITSSMNSLPTNNAAGSSTQLNLPTPSSYQEAGFMTRTNFNKEERHAIGKSEFAPRYPVFEIDKN